MPARLPIVLAMLCLFAGPALAQLNNAQTATVYVYARAVEVQKKAAAKLVSRPGTDEITMREIDQEITAYRKEKRL